MRGGAKFETKGFDRAIRQRVKALAGISITVGIHRGKMNEGLDVATYAARNNFGTKRYGMGTNPGATIHDVCLSKNSRMDARAGIPAIISIGY